MDSTATGSTESAWRLAEAAARQDALRLAELVPDAAADPRLAEPPLGTGAPRIHFDAGAPRTLPGEKRLGTLGVVDTAARAHFGMGARIALRSLAQQAASALLARRSA